LSSRILVDEIYGKTANATAATVGATGIITQPKLPFFMVNLSADQGSISDNSETVIQFNNRLDDPDSLWDTSNYRLTVDANTKGYWWIHVNLYTNSTNNVENSSVFFRVNGTKVIQQLGRNRSSGGSGTPQQESLFSFSGVIDLTTAADYFDATLLVDVSSGGTTTVNETSPYTRTYICGHRLR
jgi:hypothetical protein